MALDIIAGRNSGYPCISELPDMPPDTSMTSPLPDMYLRCTEGINDVLPAIPRLASPGICLSVLFSAEHAVENLFFGELPVKAAYFNGECVYRRL